MNDWLEKEKLPLAGWVLILTPAASLHSSPWSRFAALFSSKAKVCEEKLLSLLFFSLIYTFKTFLFAYLQFLSFFFVIEPFSTHTHAHARTHAHTHTHHRCNLQPSFLPCASRQWTNFRFHNCSVLYTCLLLILPWLSFSSLMRYYCNYCHYSIFSNKFDWYFCYGAVYSL